MPFHQEQQEIIDLTARKVPKINEHQKDIGNLARARLSGSNVTVEDYLDTIERARIANNNIRAIISEYFAGNNMSTLDAVMEGNLNLHRYNAAKQQLLEENQVLKEELRALQEEDKAINQTYKSLAKSIKDAGKTVPGVENNLDAAHALQEQEQQVEKAQQKFIKAAAHSLGEESATQLVQETRRYLEQLKMLEDKYLHGR